MKQGSIPLTKSEFENWGREIEKREKRQKEKMGKGECPDLECEGILKDDSDIIFTSGTFLKCSKCKRRFQRSKYNGKHLWTELGNKN